MNKVNKEVRFEVPTLPQKDNSSGTYVSKAKWRQDRPLILVVACSDGRYQKALDDFLGSRLGIFDYDRLYAPGGPGALVPSVISYFRGVQFQDEAKFLIDVHLIERVILIMHGPEVEEGPPDATCADYMRRLPGSAARVISEQQEKDLSKIYSFIQRYAPKVLVEIYTAEVLTDLTVQFVTIPLVSDSYYPSYK